LANLSLRTTPVARNNITILFKNFFEFFVSKKLLQFDKEADIKLRELTNRLTESIYDFGILLFVHEGWKEQVEKQMTVSTILKEYNGDENLKKFLNNIVILFLATGDVLMVKLAKYEEALEYHLKALDISDKVLGKDHPKVADSYISIGKVLNYQGKYEESLEYYFKALAISEKVLGKDHPAVAVSYNNIGNVLQTQGKYEESLEYHFKALAIREKVLGKDHPNVAASYNNIGLSLKGQGKYEEALEYIRKALPICEKKLGKNHPYTKICITIIKDLEKKLTTNNLTK